MRRYLLDTHAALWFFEDAPQLSAAACAAMSDASAEKLVSAASFYEIAIKTALGRLPPLPVSFGELCAACDFAPLAISARHAERAGALALAIRDPWDRIIAAQALSDELVVITRDPAMSELGARVLW